MKYLKILFTFIFLILLSTVTICINAQTTASATEIAEIQKLLDKIKELKDAGKANDDAEIVKLANEAIVLTDKYYKIPDDNLADKDPPGVGKAEPEYDPTYNGDGKARKSGKKVKVKLGLLCIQIVK